MSVSFFFNDPATTEIYTLSLHDALPILAGRRHGVARGHHQSGGLDAQRLGGQHAGHLEAALRPDGSTDLDGDRKSTRLNSSHSSISYAVFCLKKKKRHVAPGQPPLQAPP